jgi:hypothetical protein
VDSRRSPGIMNCMHNGNSRVVSRGPHRIGIRAILTLGNPRLAWALDRTKNYFHGLISSPTIGIHYRNKLLRGRLIPKPTAFYRGRRHRTSPRAWPKFGRRCRLFRGPNPTAKPSGQVLSFFDRLFCFAKNKRKW